MPNEVINTAIFSAILKLFLISAAGYLSVRKGFIKTGTIEGISKFVINIALPALIISTLGTNLHHHLLDELALCFAAAFALNILSFGVAYFFRWTAVPRDRKGQRLFISLSAMQNSGYLPIPLAAAVLPQDQVPLGLLLIFVYMMVMGLIFWSVSVFLVTAGAASDWKENIRKTINPPIITLLLGLFFLWTPLREAFNSFAPLKESFDIIGMTTIPLVMFVLGGSLGERTMAKKTGNMVTGTAAFVKLAAVPAFALLAVMAIPMERTFAFILVLEAAMPTALNHIVIVRKYGGDVQLTASGLFVQYLASVLTVPVFIYLFEILY